MSHRAFTSVLLCAFSCCATGIVPRFSLAAPAEDSATLRLAQVVRQDIPADATQAAYESYGPFFHHRPFSWAGFNALVLPFQYEDADHVGDAAEAQAFAFLVSNDLDWTAGSYCARHAYFTFKRSAADMMPLVGRYEPAVISKVIRTWSATHAVGGTLVRSKAGYSAHVAVYDPTGAVAWKLEYRNAMSFWDLLGEVDADVMDYFSEKPSDALAAYLRVPRCKRNESLAQLGKAAFLEERSKEEFGIYTQILANDPTFSEVRHWWSNQKTWNDGKWKENSDQQVLCLRARLSPVDLCTFSLNDERGEIDEYAGWVDRTEKLVGKDHPLVLGGRLRLLLIHPKPDATLMASALKVAGEWPNANSLICDLSAAYAWPQIAGKDYDMSVSLLCAARENLFMPALGKDAAAPNFATPMKALGHYNLAARALLNDPVPTPESQADLIWCLTQTGWYAEALDRFKNFHGDVETPRYLIPNAIFLAAVTGSKDVLGDLMQKHAGYLKRTDGLDVAEWFLAKTNGQAADKPIPRRSEIPGDPFATYRLMIQFEEDMRLGRTTGLSWLDETFQAFPNVRINWIMKDAYERQSPTADAADFYESLVWLHGDDPWVAKAVADWNTRSKKFAVHPSDPTVTIEMEKKLLSALPAQARPELSPEATPWVAAAGVKRLIDAQKIDDAIALASLYRELTHRTGNEVASAFAIHLEHLADHARKPLPSGIP